MSTSLAAYAQAISDGTISEARAKVLACACGLPTNFSQADICKQIGKSPTDFRKFGPRVRELELMGVLKHTGTKKDPVSTMSVKTYEVTGDPPRKIAKRQTTRAFKEQILRFLLSDRTDLVEEADIIDQLRQSLKLSQEELTSL